MFDTIILVFSKIFFIFFIIGSVFFGMSIAFNVFVSKTIKKISNASNSEFDKLKDYEKDSVLKSIDEATTEYLELLEISKKNKKIENSNKIRRLFKLNKKPLIKTNNSVKNIFVNLAENVSEPFILEGKKRSYLSFTETEIFSILKCLKVRLKALIDSTGIIWLKKIQLSFIIMCMSVASKYTKFKDKVWAYIIFKIFDFFLWFSRVLSPVGISKFIVKDISNLGIKSLISQTVISVCGKELALIYKEKNIANLSNNNQQSKNNAKNELSL